MTFKEPIVGEYGYADEDDQRFENQQFLVADCDKIIPVETPIVRKTERKTEADIDDYVEKHNCSYYEARKRLRLEEKFSVANAAMIAIRKTLAGGSEK